MSSNDHWMYQGRQSHGWFGHGTAPITPRNLQSDVGEEIDTVQAKERAEYAAGGIIGHIPRERRQVWASPLDRSTHRLAAAMANWGQASSSDSLAFRSHYFEPYTSDHVADLLRAAAYSALDGRTHHTLAVASAYLATAAQRVGPDRWSRFVADAADRAKSGPPITQGSEPDALYVYRPPNAASPDFVRRVATGDYHPDIGMIDARLHEIIREVVVTGNAVIRGETNPAVYGTRLHALLKVAVEAEHISGLEAEKSFIDGRAADYGEYGTVRTDVVLKDAGGDVVAVWDWKTGLRPSISRKREQDIKQAVGEKYGNIPVFVITDEFRHRATP